MTVDGPFGTPVTDVVLGQRHFVYDSTYQYTQIILKDSGNTARTLTSSAAGGLIWNTSQLATLNNLSTYATTAAVAATYASLAFLSVALAGKENTISSSTNLSIQDLTIRHLTASQSAFTINGGVITTVKDNANNTLLILENAGIAVAKPLDCQDTSTFRKTISITDTANSLNGQLYVASGNKLKWQGQEVVDVPTLNTKITAAISFTGPFSITANATLGTLGISWNVSYQHAQLVFTQSSKVLRVITQNSIENLTWDGNQLIDLPTMNTAVALKQPLISGALEVPGDLTLATYSASAGWGQPIFKFIAGVVNYLSIGFVVTALGSNNAPEALTISRDGNITVAVSLTNNSDARLKTNIMPVDASKVQALFDRAEAVTYQRIDLPGDDIRLGFLAQDFVDPAFPNLTGVNPETGTLTLDYARITCLLFQQVKTLQLRIEVLEAKVP